MTVDLRATQTALLCQDLASIMGYVPGMSMAAVRAEYGSEVVVKLASNESALPPPREVVRAMQKRGCASPWGFRPRTGSSSNNSKGPWRFKGPNSLNKIWYANIFQKKAVLIP